MKTECVNKMLSKILIILYPKFDLFVKISQKVCNHVNTPFFIKYSCYIYITTFAYKI